MRERERESRLLLLYSFHPLQTHFVKCSLSLSLSLSLSYKRARGAQNTLKTFNLWNEAKGEHKKNGKPVVFIPSSLSPILFSFFLPFIPLVFPMYRQICPRLFDARARSCSSLLSVRPPVRPSAITAIVSTCRCFPPRDITTAFTQEQKFPADRFCNSLQ